jgi:hypothetical protein
MFISPRWSLSIKVSNQTNILISHFALERSCAPSSLVVWVRGERESLTFTGRAAVYRLTLKLFKAIFTIDITLIFVLVHFRY